MNLLNNLDAALWFVGSAMFLASGLSIPRAYDNESDARQAWLLFAGGVVSIALAILFRTP